jgi:hypothetical protein
LFVFLIFLKTKVKQETLSYRLVVTKRVILPSTLIKEEEGVVVSLLVALLQLALNQEVDFAVDVAQLKRTDVPLLIQRGDLVLKRIDLCLSY